MQTLPGPLIEIRLEMDAEAPDYILDREPPLSKARIRRVVRVHSLHVPVLTPHYLQAGCCEL